MIETCRTKVNKLCISTRKGVSQRVGRKNTGRNFTLRAVEVKVFATIFTSCAKQLNQAATTHLRCSSRSFSSTLCLIELAELNSSSRNGIWEPWGGVEGATIVEEEKPFASPSSSSDSCRVELQHLLLRVSFLVCLSLL